MRNVDLHTARDHAVTWAREAGSLAVEQFGPRLEPRRKADASPVTEVDEAAQALLVQRVRAAYPDHGIIGEEACRHTGSTGYTWIIDPIDGTRNFAQGVPLFCIALALMCEDLPVVGVIHDPIAGVTYHAVRGGGAFVDERPARVAAAWTVDALVGLAVGRTQRWPAAVVGAVAALGTLRNLGSTSLHLALVATGGLTAACARNAKLWDVAPGAVLVEEAGGVITGLTGAALFPQDVDGYAGQHIPFIAAGSAVHGDVVAALDA